MRERDRERMRERTREYNSEMERERTREYESDMERERRRERERERMREQEREWENERERKRTREDERERVNRLSISNLNLTVSKSNMTIKILNPCYEWYWGSGRARRCSKNEGKLQNNSTRSTKSEKKKNRAKQKWMTEDILKLIDQKNRKIKSKDVL